MTIFNSYVNVYQRVTTSNPSPNLGVFSSPTRGILRWGQRAVPERPVIVVELFAGSGEAAKLRAQDDGFRDGAIGEANGILQRIIGEIMGKYGTIIGKLYEIMGNYREININYHSHMLHVWNIYQHLP